MSFSFSMNFEGLCAFARRAGAVEVYLMFGHGEHGANLVIPSKSLNIPQTTWKPSRVGMMYEDVAGTPRPLQVAMWHLHGEEVTITDGTGTGAPVFRNPERLIDFNARHIGAKTLTKKAIRSKDNRVAIIKFVGDGSIFEPETPTELFEVKQKGAATKEKLAQAVAWKPSDVPKIQNRAGDAIVFKTTLPAWAAIANAAPVQSHEGLAHFHHYYGGASIDTGGGDTQIELQHAFADVYDCVPPVLWPD